MRSNAAPMPLQKKTINLQQQNVGVVVVWGKNRVGLGESRSQLAVSSLEVPITSICEQINGGLGFFFSSFLKPQPERAGLTSRALISTERKQTKRGGGGWESLSGSRALSWGARRAVVMTWHQKGRARHRHTDSTGVALSPSTETQSCQIGDEAQLWQAKPSESRKKTH